MEYTASIDRPFLTSSKPLALKQVLTGVSTAAWLFVVQLACYVLRGKVGFTSSLGDVVVGVGMLAAVFGIYHGLRWSGKGARLRGGNCAAVNIVALLFWTSQLIFSQIPLFQ
jgi:hypothetical protein